MKRIQGILGLLIAIVVITTLGNHQTLTDSNVYYLIQRTALFGILAIGVAFVIITGGIDLSIGSVVGLTGALLAVFLQVGYQDTGKVFTVKEVDIANKRLLFDQPPDILRHLDRIIIEDPKTKQPKSLDIDRQVIPAGSPAELLAFKEQVRWVKPGMTANALIKKHMSPTVAILLVMLISIGIGVFHGLLITKLKLQPFVVTLCGLLIYRGFARGLTGDNVAGFKQFFGGLKYLAKGQPFSIPAPGLNWVGKGNWGSQMVNDKGEALFNKAGKIMYDSQGNIMLNADGTPQMFPEGAADQPIMLDFIGWIPVPMPFLIMIAIGIISAIFLHKTIYGRYLLALGRNEQAAKFSGIKTDRMVIMAYVICSGLAGLGGILFALDINSIQPAGHGSFYELYAIAAAVLGGCSLRGGEGSITGVIVGTAVMRSLPNSINMLQYPTHLEYLIVGVVLLIGVIADELVKRVAAKRRAIREAKAMAELSDATASPP